jgi:hypothetical protein
MHWGAWLASFPGLDKELFIPSHFFTAKIMNIKALQTLFLADASTWSNHITGCNTQKGLREC